MGGAEGRVPFGQVCGARLSASRDGRAGYGGYARSGIAAPEPHWLSREARRTRRYGVRLGSVYGLRGQAHLT